MSRKKFDNRPKHATSPLARLELRARIARMEREGMSQAEIGRELGMTTPAVNYHIKRMREEYQRSIDTDRTWMAYEKQLAIEEVYHQAEEGFRRSQEGVTEDGDVVEKPGDPAFLKVKLDSVKAFRELRGLDAPTKTDVRAAVVSVDLPPGAPLTDDGRLDFDALAGRPAVPDPVAEAIAAEQRALPPAVNVNGSKVNGKPKKEKP